MPHRSACVLPFVALLVAAWPAAAANVDRDTVRIRAVQPPLVDAAALDYDALTAEIAYGEIRIGEPALRTTKSWCVPKGSENPFKDAVEIPTHYYEIPWEAGDGAVVVRDGDGRTVFAARLDAVKSSERFGYDSCAYLFPKPLEDDFAGKLPTVERDIERSVDETFRAFGERETQAALFFDILEEKVPLYTFKDKRHDYSDLDRAAELARRGYEAGAAGEEELREALSLWQAALEQSELNDKEARIDRKVSVKLYESVGIAHLVLGDPVEAVRYLDKAQRYTAMSTSRSSGTGSADLLERARERSRRSGKNPGMPEDPQQLEALIASVESHRGGIPLRTLPHAEAQRLLADHASWLIKEAVVVHVDEENARRDAVDAGRENPYERQVGRTAAQGFYLFLMPYGNRLREFPPEITELTHLNQLRMPKHGFDSVPESIGNMTELRYLDLSGNKIERLPESISQLTNLKTLKIKDNPLAPGELERIEKLLPDCKIKG